MCSSEIITQTIQRYTETDAIYLYGSRAKQTHVKVVIWILQFYLALMKRIFWNVSVVHNY